MFINVKVSFGEQHPLQTRFSIPEESLSINDCIRNGSHNIYPQSVQENDIIDISVQYIYFYSYVTVISRTQQALYPLLELSTEIYSDTIKNFVLEDYEKLPFVTGLLVKAASEW